MILVDAVVDPPIVTGSDPDVVPNAVFPEIENTVAGRHPDVTLDALSEDKSYPFPEKLGATNVVASI